MHYVFLYCEVFLSTIIIYSLVQGYQQRRGYIATQGPLEHTTGDLWRMVVENECSCIVMLCTLREGEEVCCICLYAFIFNLHFIESEYLHILFNKTFYAAKSTVYITLTFPIALIEQYMHCTVSLLIFFLLQQTEGVPSLLAQVPRRGRHLW